jgi:hypothetical protein
MCAVAGCPMSVVPPEPDGEVIDGNRDSSVTSPLGKTSGEPDNTFTEAIVAVFDETHTARLQGTVASVGDMDVFLLGEVSAGDRVVVDVETTGSALDASVAIFDAEQRLVYTNDDRGGSGSRVLDPYIDWVTRHPGDAYYLVVTHAAFAASDRRTGSYRIDVHITGGLPVPEPAGQILLLDFDGGQVSIPGRSPMSLLSFDAASISPVYRGQTDVMKEAIRATFEQNFVNFDVMIVTSDDPPLPTGTQFSTVHFGGFDPAAFGIADGVDLYNFDWCDDAVIFTESFEPGIFLSVPTATEMGIAIGNIGSHEAGHLLGLNHVDDDHALMDDRSPADAFLEDQEFMEAPLSSDIMPIGTQDAVLLLLETVGPGLDGPDVYEE